MDNEAIEFSEKENQNIAAIDLNVLKRNLPTEQFMAISKLISCISACVQHNEKPVVSQFEFRKVFRA